ncbi:NADH-quinone oxidoreductase subunit C [Thermococcus henrietii]|uniref:NADH-quinone oxidoreductase subunit C n=1 Tax=Thermococcus henrietii TaxID=2016361 RepID=UPI000C082DB0|nr:NADH-quinone oxidoreductase subunit C [Thermococcus henrietii]
MSEVNDNANVEKAREEVKEPTKAEKVAKAIAERFPNAQVEVKTNKWGRERVWVRIDRESYRELMRFIKTLDGEAHYSIGIEQDWGDDLGFLSHLVIYYDDAPAVSLLIDVHAPKDDPTLPDISDIFPIALQFEREGMEMVGIDFENAPDKRRLFLPDDFPEGIYPLRLDDKGVPEEMVHNAGHPYYLKGGAKK